MDFNVLQMCFNLVPSIILLVVTYFFNRTTKQHEQEIIEEQTKRKALSDGVEALLRQKIIDSYNKHQRVRRFYRSVCHIFQWYTDY